MKIRYKSENFWYRNVYYEINIVKYVESSFIVIIEMV